MKALPKRTALVLACILSFAAGHLVSLIQLRGCRMHGAAVERDLKWAVNRGVLVEAELILCKQQKEKK